MALNYLWGIGINTLNPLLNFVNMVTPCFAFVFINSYSGLSFTSPIERAFDKLNAFYVQEVLCVSFIRNGLKMEGFNNANLGNDNVYDSSSSF